MPTKLFNKTFLLQALENSLVTGLSTFGASNVFTTTPTWKGLVAAATAAGMSALYTFVKQLGGTQATKALLTKQAA